VIVIGSKALLAQLYNLSSIQIERYLKSDYDVLMTYDEFLDWQGKYIDYIKDLYPTQPNKYKAIVEKDGTRKLYEIELDSAGTSSKYLLDHNDEVTNGLVEGFFGELYEVLNLKYLFLTKKSHIMYPVHFEKNIADYLFLNNLIGSFDLDESMSEYYSLRSAEAKVRYNLKTPKLNVSKEDFFSSKLNVPNYYVHDDIHDVMAHNDRPIFTMMQPDPDSAWCAKDLFFELPYDYQVQCVQEEGYVIALERYIIPQYGDDWDNYYECYKKAVKRICTTLTSGWFRSFALDNYDEVLRRYNPGFVEKFEAAVKSGVIREIEKDQI
jgi:hypothetical protein